jgi:DNA-directed RNA polymerase subunit M/transcription elongation factor TFIIS
MADIDPAGEWRQLSERYRGMSDEELIVIAREISSLTEVAQQALTQEISYRKLTIPPEERAAPAGRGRDPEPEPDPESPYAEDRELVELCTVWSLRDAVQVQALLDRAGIPFFMGPEKATGLDTVTSDFLKGVGVKIMRVGMPWARQAMLNYAPADEPDQKQDEAHEEIVVRCPACHSTEVVLGRLVKDSTAEDSSAPFEWTCDSCGHQWEDDGITKEE